MFGTVKLVITAFDREGSESFNNDYAKNVVFFVGGNSSSSYIVNLKSNFLVLGKGPNFGINVQQKKW